MDQSKGKLALVRIRKHNSDRPECALAQFLSSCWLASIDWCSLYGTAQKMYGETFVWVNIDTAFVLEANLL